jgi:hypothetical protein
LLPDGLKTKKKLNPHTITPIVIEYEYFWTLDLPGILQGKTLQADTGSKKGKTKEICNN